MYWPCHGDQDEFLRNGTKYIPFPRNGTIKYFFNPFNVISPGIIIIWYQLWYFTSTHLQVCGCIWGLHTEPVCWGPSWRGLWTWLVGSSTCHCWTPQTDRCWSHQSSIQEDLQRHRAKNIFKWCNSDGGSINNFMLFKKRDRDDNLNTGTTFNGLGFWI